MALRSAAGLKSSSGSEPLRHTFKDAIAAEKASSSQKTSLNSQPVMTKMSSGNNPDTFKPGAIIRPRNESISEPETISNAGNPQSSQATNVKTDNDKFDAVHGDSRGQQMVANASSGQPETNTNPWASPDAMAESSGSNPSDTGDKTGAMSHGGNSNNSSRSKLPTNDDTARAYYANNMASGPIGRRIAGRTFDFANRHRKSLIFGGGGFGIILALIFATIAFLPLKLESLMTNIIGYQEERMQAYAENRARIIVYRYLFGRVNGTLESDPMYVNSNIIRMLYGNMVKDQFEQKLFAKENIRIERGSNGGIRFTSASGQVVEARTVSELKNVFRTDPTGISLDATIARFTENQYKGWRILQRRSVRYYLAKSYDVKRWGITKKEDKTDPETKIHDTELQARSLALDGPHDTTVESLGCTMSPEDCQDKDPYKRSADPNGDPAFKPISAPGSNDDERKAQEESKKSLREQYDELKKTSGRVIEGVLSKVIGETAAKALLKAVPIIGWISLAADIDYYIWEGTWFKLGVTLRSLQYVTVAQTWASLKDQMKADQLTASQINVLMQMIDGVEKSNAYQRTNSNNVDGGVKIPEDKRVGSDSSHITEAGRYGLCGSLYLGSNEYRGIPEQGYTFSEYEQWTLWYRRLTTPTAHFNLCIIRSAINKIIELGIALANITHLSDLLGFITDITGLDSAINWLSENIAELLGRIYEKIFGLVYNGEWGAPLANAIDGGWEIIANNFLRDNFGAARISYQTSYEQTTQFAHERLRNLQSQGPFASLTAWEVPGSTGSRILAMLPATPAAAANQFSSLATSLFLHPANYIASTIRTFSPTSLAVEPPSLRSPVGVVHYGLDAATLEDTELRLATEDINGPPDASGNYPGPDGRIDIYDCTTIEGKMIGSGEDVTDSTKIDPCRFNTSVAVAMCAGSNHSNDDGGIGSGGEAGPCGFVEPVPSSSPLNANWMSGASFLQGDRATGFGAWRGEPTTIVGTWCDIPDCTDGSTAAAYDSFNGALDIAIGGIFKQNGESWGAAAGGAYNSRWQAAINNIASMRNGKGLTFIRFAHESNMNFSQWSVMPGEEAAYKTTYCNVAAMAHAAGLKMTWSLNDGTLGGAASPISAYPGDSCVDVVGPDTYDWDTPLEAAMPDGSPIGIETWRQFALKHGKPLAFPEWGANNTQGQTKDNAAYIQTMNDFMTKNAGSGPGQFIYDVYFNEDEGGYRIGLWPSADVPQMAAKYVELKWGN